MRSYRVAVGKHPCLMCLVPTITPILQTLIFMSGLANNNSGYEPMNPDQIMPL